MIRLLTGLPRRASLAFSAASLSIALVFTSCSGQQPEQADEPEKQSVEQQATPQKVIVQGTLFGQNEQGETVEAVANAQIEFLGEDGTAVGSARTNEAGFFTIPDLEPGTLRYRVIADGYEKEDNGRGIMVDQIRTVVHDLYVAKAASVDRRGGSESNENGWGPATAPASEDSVADFEAETASVQGHVFGQNDAGKTLELVAGAKVELTTVDGKTAGTATTDDDGFYAIRNLQTGDFRFKVRASDYQTEQENRGFRLPSPGAHHFDLFLARPSEEAEPGELVVKVFELKQQDKLPVKNASVEALQLKGRHVLQVGADSQTGQHRTRLTAGKWSVVASAPGLQPAERKTVDVPAGERAVCEFILKRTPPTDATPQVFALVGVEQGVGDNNQQPAVWFGQPLDRVAGENPLKRGSSDDSDRLTGSRIEGSLRKLTTTDLPRVGRTPQQLPPGTWEWYLARPKTPLAPGVYQATASLDGGPSKISPGKTVQAVGRTVFDLFLAAKTPPTEDDPEDETSVQGYIYGQNDQGKTIERIGGAKIQLLDSDGTVVASTSADKTGFYHIDQIQQGEFKYRLRAHGWATENKGRGFSIPGFGVHIIDLYLARETKIDDPSEVDPPIPPGKLAGFVAEETKDGRRPLNARNDGAVVKLVSVRSGETVFVRPDDKGNHEIELDEGKWLINATAKRYDWLPQPGVVEITRGTTQRRNFVFRTRSGKGTLRGGFWELTADQVRDRLAEPGAAVELSNVRTGQRFDLLTTDAAYSKQLSAGDWQITPVPPTGYEIVSPHGEGIVKINRGKTTRRDFVVRKIPLGKLVVRVWESSNDGKLPSSANVVLRTDDGRFDEIPVAGEHSTRLSPCTIAASLIVPPGFESVERNTTTTTKIESGGTSTCEFVIRRKPCVTGPVQAVVSVNQRDGAKEYIKGSDLAVFFMDANSLQQSDVAIATADVIPASTIRRLTRQEFPEYGIPANDPRGIWFLAEAGQVLPPGNYMAEASLDGYHIAQSLPRPVICCADEDGDGVGDLSTVFDLHLQRRTPRVTVVVVNKDDQPLPGTEIKVVAEGKSLLRDAITMTTDATGRDHRVLEDGVGVYKVLLAPKGYQAFGKRVTLVDDENILRFRLFKNDEQRNVDFSGIVLGKTVSTSNDVTTKQETVTISGAKIELQPVGDAVVEDEFQKPFFSQDAGEFRKDRLPEGIYHVMVSAMGYRPLITQIEVIQGMKPVELVLERRNKDYDNAIACMLTSGWGATLQTRQAVRYYYEKAVAIDPNHCAADYALTLCMLKDRRFADAREQVIRATRKQSGDFVWDRAAEVRLWLNMLLNEHPSAISEMHALVGKDYAQRVENPASSDTAYLMGVSYAVLQGPLKEQTASYNVAQNESKMVAALNSSQLRRFRRGQADVALVVSRFESEVSEIIKQCKLRFEQRKQSEITRIESRIKVTEREATKDQVTLSSLSVEEIDVKLEALTKQEQELQVEWNRQAAAYSQLEREYLSLLAILRQCQRNVSTTTYYHDVYDNGYQGGSEMGGGGGFGDGSAGGFGNGGQGNQQPPNPPVPIVGFAEPDVPELETLDLSAHPAVLAQSVYSGDETQTRTRIVRRETRQSTECLGYERQVQAVRLRGSQISQIGTQIKNKQRTVQLEYQRLVNLKIRILNHEKRLEAKIKTAEIDVERAEELRQELESITEMGSCVEVEAKRKEMVQFFWYRNYPLEQRRQEMLQWVFAGEEHTCESVGN